MQEKRELTGWKRALAALGKTVAVLVVYGGILEKMKNSVEGYLNLYLVQSN